MTASKWIALFTALCICVGSAVSQDDDFDVPPPREKMMQKIEDLRKVRLLDVLNLQGDQVEKFFFAYNKLQSNVIATRQDMMEKAKTLRNAAKSADDTGLLTSKTDDTIAAMKTFEDAVNKRHKDLKPLLTSKQYATYIAFEAQFQEELTRLIVQRARKNR